jgi:hypothetical protein
MKSEKKYTCADYRMEMKLLSLKISLNNKKLSFAEKKYIKDQINELEISMGMD